MNSADVVKVIRGCYPVLLASSDHMVCVAALSQMLESCLLTGRASSEGVGNGPFFVAEMETAVVFGKKLAEASWRQLVSQDIANKAMKRAGSKKAP